MSTGVTAVPGFTAGGVACGIKDGGALDLALVATTDAAAVPAAAVFTSNKMTAAPVLVTARHLDATGGRAAAVILNSGNANAATGAQGEDGARRMAAAAATHLGCATEEVLVCSTGLIGIPLPIERVEAAAAALVDARSQEGGEVAAEAIRTTDTHRKEVVVAGDGFTIGGMAKGAAMLAPDMATMLAVLTTDAAVRPDDLGPALRRAVSTSFNAMSVDGCQSTNDTVIVLAGGGGPPVDGAAFEEALHRACRDLAEQMVGDAEGATKVVRVAVHGARDDAEAAAGARRVADSLLCKCSWYGEDPYWGRVASELGSAGIGFDQGRLSVSYGGVVVARDGVAAEHDAAAVAGHMAGRAIDIVADLGLGDGRAMILTNDLTHAYVDENMGTS